MLVGPAEVHWGERQLRLPSEGGFLPLARDRDTGRVGVYGMNSCCRLPRRCSFEADARLGGLLVATRIAQALRSMLAQAPRR